jgi:hypothetical protein
MNDMIRINEQHFNRLVKRIVNEMSNPLLKEQLLPSASGVNKPAQKWSPEKLSKLKRGLVPFKNYEEGNEFRNWFRKWNPNLAINLDLSQIGPYNNEYIQRAWHYPWGNESVGDYYTRKTKSTQSSTTKPNQTSIKYDAILIGGLDNRAGDLNIDQQVGLLKQGLGQNMNVKGFRYNTSTSEINEFLKNNPKIPIYTFSAGAVKVSDLSLNPNVNIKKLFVIEPYGASQKTKEIVNSAISNGMPSNNVFVGDSIYTGLGISQNVQKSDSTSHWQSLTNVARKTSSSLNSNLSNRINKLTLNVR